MPIFTIQTSSQPFYSQKTALDGVDYLISFAYNQRENRIYLSLADDEEVPIISGIKVMTNWPLLHRFRSDARIPPGEIMAIGTTGDGTPPGLGELGAGKRVRLVYFDAAWLAAARPPPPPLPVLVEIFVAIRIVVAPAYSGDSNFSTEVATALANACNTHFGAGSSVTPSEIPALVASFGLVTGVAVGQSAPPTGPTTVSSTITQLYPSQAPHFNSSRITVLSV